MALRVDINVKNLELNDRLRDYVEKKIGKLDRYLDVLEEAKVDLTYAKTARSAKDRNIAQVTIRGKGVLLRRCLDCGHANRIFGGKRSG